MNSSDAMGIRNQLNEMIIDVKRCENPPYSDFTKEILNDLRNIKKKLVTRFGISN